LLASRHVYIHDIDKMGAIIMPMKQAAKLGRRSLIAGAGAATLGAPLIAGAAPAAVKIGLLQPLTGFLAYDGIQGKYGAMLAIDEINAAGGIKSLGGAKLETVLADAQASPAVAISEVDRLAGEGVVAIHRPTRAHQRVSLRPRLRQGHRRRTGQPGCPERCRRQAGQDGRHRA
jgi:ABC-type branched-subunit amino acid transport system substrate-binding protein